MHQFKELKAGIGNQTLVTGTQNTVYNEKMRILKLNSKNICSDELSSVYKAYKTQCCLLKRASLVSKLTVAAFVVMVSPVNEFGTQTKFFSKRTFTFNKQSQHKVKELKQIES